MRLTNRIEALEASRPDDSAPVTISIIEIPPTETPSRTEHVRTWGRLLVIRCHRIQGECEDGALPYAIELPLGELKLCIGIPPEELV